MIRILIENKIEMKMNLSYLGQRQCGNKINEEIGLNVPPCNHLGVPYKLTPSKNPRTRSNISCSKFNNQMQKVKKIRNGPPKGDNNLQMQISFHTVSLIIPTYTRQIKV